MAQVMGLFQTPDPRRNFVRQRYRVGPRRPTHQKELEKEKKKKMQRGNAGEVVMKIIIMIFFKTKKLVLLQTVLETRKTQKNFFDCLSLGV
jgi:hypothetical protein